MGEHRRVRAWPADRPVAEAMREPTIWQARVCGRAACDYRCGADGSSFIFKWNWWFALHPIPFRNGAERCRIEDLRIPGAVPQIKM
jgi:hypothetical protein